MAFNARTAECTRLARQLHDTLLQTLQGSNLIAEHAHETVNSVSEVRRIFGLLKDWLTRADGEGRAVLDVLREETTEEDIERALQGAIDPDTTLFGHRHDSYAPAIAANSSRYPRGHSDRP